MPSGTIEQDRCRREKERHGGVLLGEFTDNALRCGNSALSKVNVLYRNPNVVGLPLFLLSKMLSKFGISLW